jgi:hypothetical protein
MKQVRFSYRIAALFFLVIVFGALPASAVPVQQQPIAAVTAFTKALPAELRSRLLYPFNHDERFNFGWVPGTREGVSLKDVDNKQRALFYDVLRSVLSPTGFKKVKNILLAEAALAVIEDAPSYRDPRKYWLTVFGKPGLNQKWGLRFEGHHLSLNYTFKGNRIDAAMPSFIGSNPSVIPSGPHKGLRPLARDIDSVWALYNSLTPAQKNRAREGGGLLGGLKSSPGTKTYNIGYQDGITVVEMTEKQISLLLDVVKAFIEYLPAPYVQSYLKSLRRREIGSLRFHWSGADKPGGSYLYRIQGRRLLIEHDAHDDSGHIHSIWRDKGFDFGIKTRWTPWDYDLKQQK